MILIYDVYLYAICKLYFFLILTHACAELQAKAVQEQHRLEKEMSSQCGREENNKKNVEEY